MLLVEGLDFKDYLVNFEQGLIQQVFDDVGGVVVWVVECLCICCIMLVEKMCKYGMSWCDDDLLDD